MLCCRNHALSQSRAAVLAAQHMPQVVLAEEDVLGNQNCQIAMSYLPYRVSKGIIACDVGHPNDHLR